MILKFRHVPRKDKRYDCIDCMHIEIDTDKKTYYFYEDKEPGEGIEVRLKSDMTALHMMLLHNGFKEKQRCIKEERTNVMDEIQKFESLEAAKEYAELNLGKYQWEIVDINGKKTWLSATSIPLEERFRDPIEQVVENFLKEMGMENENDRLDIAMFIGAEMCNQLLDMIEKHSPYGIESAFQEF